MPDAPPIRLRRPRQAQPDLLISSLGRSLTVAARLSDLLRVFLRALAALRGTFPQSLVTKNEQNAGEDWQIAAPAPELHRGSPEAFSPGCDGGHQNTQAAILGPSRALKRDAVDSRQ